MVNFGADYFVNSNRFYTTSNCKCYLIVIPLALVVCLIYTPEARGLRVYISGKL